MEDMLWEPRPRAPSLGLLGAPSAFAGEPIKQAGNFGIGLGVGTTAAPISMKYFLNDALSIRGTWAGGAAGGAAISRVTSATTSDR